MAPLNPEIKASTKTSPVDFWANDPTKMIIPTFWNGKTPAIDPSKYQIDCKNMDLKKYLIAKDDDPSSKSDFVLDPQSDPMIADLQIRMQDMFDKIGVVNLTNTGLEAFPEMSAAVALMIPETMVYEGGANLRGYLEKNVYDTGAPKEAHLHYHHEMAYVQESTKWLGFCCLEGCSNVGKGMTFVSDNIHVTDELMKTDLGRKLKEKGLCYIRKLPDRQWFIDNNLDTSIVYNYWQTSMCTEDSIEAEKVARKKGLEVEWQDSPIFGRYMVTKFYVSCFEYCPFTDRNLLYASVADDYMWFDTWPGVNDLPHEERPLKLNFGDDTIMTREEKQLFVDVYDKYGIPIYWKKGDLVVICNLRMAHGRPSYALEDDEKRELGVVLGATFVRQGDMVGKW